MSNSRRFFYLLFVFAMANGSFFQHLKAQITEETYHRAEYFLTNSIQNEIYHLEVIPNWIEGSKAFVHVTNTPEGKRFFKTNTQTLETQIAFDHEVLAKLIQEKTGEGVDQANLPIERVSLVNGKTVTFQWRNHNWNWNTENGSLESIPMSERNEMETFSPDRKWKAFTRNYNLFVKNLTTGEETQVSFDGKKDFEYASFYGWSDLIYGENGERPAHFSVTWSPD
ncbi:MAG TPA: DPP IV N-terminal domain-containing protein, partial [Algoriphagus sp.]|nr:DPP IV N-terminal domain-containing protein [Algoriphagus sp.]